MMRKIRVDFLAKLKKCNYTNLFSVIKSQYKATTINKSLAMISTEYAAPALFCAAGGGWRCKDIQCCAKEMKTNLEAYTREFFSTIAYEISFPKKFQ